MTTMLKRMLLGATLGLLVMAAGRLPAQVIVRKAPADQAQEPSAVARLRGLLKELEAQGAAPEVQAELRAIIETIEAAPAPRGGIAVDPRPVTTNRTYVSVEQGDTLPLIMRRVYKDSEISDPMIARVIELNSIEDPRRLEVGRRLEMPPVVGRILSRDSESGHDGFVLKGRLVAPDGRHLEGMRLYHPKMKDRAEGTGEAPQPGHFTLRLESDVEGRIHPESEGAGMTLEAERIELHNFDASGRAGEKVRLEGTKGARVRIIPSLDDSGRIEGASEDGRTVRLELIEEIEEAPEDIDPLIEGHAKPEADDRLRELFIKAHGSQAEAQEMEALVAQLRARHSDFARKHGDLAETADELDRLRLTFEVHSAELARRATEARRLGTHEAARKLIESTRSTADGLRRLGVAAGTSLAGAGAAHRIHPKSDVDDVLPMLQELKAELGELKALVEELRAGLASRRRDR